MRRKLGHPVAAVQYVEGVNLHGQRRGSFGDQVELRAPLEDLKGRPLATVTLTPAEARHLALELLAAAERAEQNGTGQ